MAMISAGDNKAQLITRAPPMEESLDGIEERYMLCYLYRMRLSLSRTCPLYTECHLSM
jgi:hypothetical protein